MVDFEKKIKERKQQAVDSQIESKAEFVTHVLGKTKEDRYHMAGWDYKDVEQTFKDEHFSISVTFNGHAYDDKWTNSHTNVLYDGKTVFEASRIVDHPGTESISKYIPGAWEESFKALDVKAHKKIERQKKAVTAQTRQRAAKDAHDNFGF